MTSAHVLPQTASLGSQQYSCTFIVKRLCPLLILNRLSPKPKKNDKFNSSGVIVVNIKNMEQLGAYFDTPHFGSFECCLYKYTLIFKLKTF